MDITKFVNTIKEQVAQNRLEQAIEELKNFMQNHDYYNEVIIQSARYNDIESQIRMNTVSKIDADVEKNKIRLAILQIADNIQKHIIKSALNDLETGSTNSIKIDGNRNIVLQDVNESTITININNETEIKEFIKNFGDRLNVIENWIKQNINPEYTFTKLIQNAKNIGNQYGNNNTQNFS